MNRRRIFRSVLAGLAAALWLMTGTAGLAASRGEENRWNAALRYFKEDQWGSALTNLNAFTNDFPNSDNYAQAVLFLAQAEYHLAQTSGLNDATKRPWSFQDAVDLLKNQSNRAGPLADQFLWWTAEAEYADSNYAAAADLFAQLARDYESRRAEALYREAECYHQAKDLPRVAQKLGAPDGAFQQLVKTNARGESAARAFLLLTETDLALKDYAAATNALQQMPPQPPGTELEWKRQYLLVSAPLEAGRPQEALDNSTNLLAAALGNAPDVTRSRMILAKIERQLGEAAEASSNYEAVLNSDTNLASQRAALLNIVEVNLESSRLDEAAAKLDQFIKHNPDEQGSDYYCLLLGELRLREHFQAPAPALVPGANLLRAETNFEAVIQNTNSDLRGKAWLYLGWCWWAEGKVSGSGDAFSNAVQLLPPGEERAEARFKLGDAEYAQKDYPEAISNYHAVIEEGGSFAVVTNNLFERALYQILGASTEMSPPDLAAATDAAGRILAWFPNGLLGEPSELVLGQAEDRAGKAGEARERFARFIARWPQSPLRPEVELAIARTYERQFDWTNAAAQYANWTSTWSNNPSLPVAEYSLARAQFEAGDETNAFAGFKDFVGKYPTNELAPQAHYWIGKYHYARDEWPQAEDSFQEAYHATKGATPDLKFEARMWAGRAAWQRQDYGGAAKYFKELSNETNFTVEKRLEAQFALADVQSPLFTATNFSGVNYALEIYASIATNPASGRLAVAARGMMAGCYLLLSGISPTNYLEASNNYEQVVTASNADLRFRCLAEFGMAKTLEGLAGLAPAGSAESNADLDGAIEHCLNVVNGANLREGESRNLLEVQRCGFEAGRLMKELGEWDKAMQLYKVLSGDLDLPSVRSKLEAELAEVRQHLPATSN